MANAASIEGDERIYQVLKWLAYSLLPSRYPHYSTNVKNDLDRFVTEAGLSVRNGKYEMSEKEKYLRERCVKV
ncbi:MAG: hypothetical protein ACYCQJ_03635 [Nitrososphaerales archaeon]